MRGHDGEPGPTPAITQDEGGGQTLLGFDVTSEYWAAVQLLLDRGVGISEIKSPEGLLTAAARDEWSGHTVMRRSLKQGESDVQITQRVVMVAAGNKSRGEEMMRLLLDRRGSEVRIIEGVITAAKQNEGSGEAVIRLLLKRRGINVQALTEAAELKNKFEKERVKIVEKMGKIEEERMKGVGEEMKMAAEQASLRFRYAVGRKFSFPSHLCSTWQVSHTNQTSSRSFLAVPWDSVPTFPQTMAWRT